MIQHDPTIRCLFAVQTSKNICTTSPTSTKAGAFLVKICTYSGPAWDVTSQRWFLVFSNIFEAQLLAKPATLVSLEEHLHAWRRSQTYVSGQGCLQFGTPKSKR